MAVSEKLRDLARSVIEQYGLLADYEDVEAVASGLHLSDEDMDQVLDLIENAVVRVIL